MARRRKAARVRRRTTVIVGQTYERAKLLARELEIDDAHLFSAATPDRLEGLIVDRWLLEHGVGDDVLQVAEAEVRRRGATIEFVGLQWRPTTG